MIDFEQFLLTKGDTAKQVGLVVSRIRRIFKGCKFVIWTDISASAVSRYLNELEGIEGISKRTRNYYLKAIKHF